MPEAVSPEDLHKRRMRSMELRRKGFSYPGIVRELQKEGWFVSITQVYADVNMRLRQMMKEETEESDLIRQLELDRLDVALNAVMPRVELGDDHAIQSMLKIQLRRAKLLGLDAPVKREIDDKRDNRRRSREELMTSLVEVQRKLEAMGVKLLPSAQSNPVIEAEVVPTTSQSAGQTAIENSDEIEENE